MRHLISWVVRKRQKRSVHLNPAALPCSETKLQQRLQDKSVRMVSLCVSAEEALAAVEPKRRSAPVRYAVVELLSREGSLTSSEDRLLHGRDDADAARSSKSRSCRILRAGGAARQPL